MPTPPPVTELDDALLDDFYDRGSLQRGRVYARNGHIAKLTVMPGAIEAHCEGSGPDPYMVVVHWIRRGPTIDLLDSCSCPLGGACKHCVAAIITARNQAASKHAPGPAPSPTAEWRRTLADLPTTDDAVAEPTALALEFSIERPRPTSYQPNPTPRPRIRPMRRGKKGKWIKSGASWREISSAHNWDLRAADPRQIAAVRAVSASGRLDAYYGAAAAVALDHFGPDIWIQVERATEVGVALIDDRGRPVVLSPAPARVQVELTADEAGAVHVSARFTIDGEPIDVRDERGSVGTPAHGLWDADADGLRLIPLTAALHPAVQRLVAAGSLIVPAGDVDEFLDVYQPALARHAGVDSPDGSVAITTNRFAGLVLTIERTALDIAELRWSYRYRRGERTTLHPLRASGGALRDRDAEHAALVALELPTHLLPGLAGPDGGPRDRQVTGTEVITLLTEVVPWLEVKCDVEVVLTGDHPTLREATDDPLISLAMRDGGGRDGTDWFDLDVTVTVDGQIVDFVGLFTALNRDDEALILPSGTWLRLDRPELTKLRQLITEARGLAEPDGDTAARVNPFQTSWWDDLAALGVVTEQSERWATNLERMGALTAPDPVALPAGLDATLRHYQHEGLDWLAFLHRNRLGGILADDMGLGKTVQALALCLHILERDPDARFLVVAPTSVVENWASEAARFAPGIEVRTIKETKARRGTDLATEVAGAGIVVTSYALFRIEFDAYAAHDWELLLIDEAQFVKNHQGKTYQCVRRLEATTKIAITGTPIENSLMDLWSLLSITAPGLFPDPRRFADTYRKPIESGAAPELLGTLRRRIAPLLRRRTKDEVLTELPPKTEQTVEVELGARHARIYQTQLQRQRQKVLGLVGDVQRHRFEILKSLTILRQLALDPGLVDDKHDGVGSAKLDRLLDDLDQVVAEGHRALVFSQFTRYLARVRTRLDAAGIAYSYLDGRTRKRDEAIGKFKDGDAPVFLISLKAGGVGLNLTEADYCFVLDPWWNPATETQAVDRAHRMGQQNPVMVYRYVSTGTIEEKVMELKARKAALFSSVMDAEGALAGALTEDDIRGLLDIV